MQTSIVIANRFCGPPTSGNGGYSCGVLGRELADGAEVTLHRPPPLDIALQLERHADGLHMLDGEHLVAKARAVAIDLEPPTPPGFSECKEHEAQFVGYDAHAFPTCFVCGPKRAEGDGLRIFPTRHRDGGPVGAAWVPDVSVCDASGNVLPEIVWAALDCPGYFGVAEVGETAVLGRMSAVVRQRPSAHERCVVIGWGIERAGRKLHAGTALFGEDGKLCALSKQIWIKIDLHS